MRRTAFALPLLVLFWLSAAAAPGAMIADTESATHGDAAAAYQLVETYTYPGFSLIQLDLSVLSHYSYLLVSDGQALVVDPGRDVSAYLDAARKAQATIMGVFLTHSHADFVAGHTELAKAANCPIFASAAGKAAYPHKSLADGATLSVGKARVTFLATPGHTPDGLCGLVADETGTPRALLSGDTLFIGSVGRPDLMGGQVSAAHLAGMLFDSWHEKLSKLPDEVNIFPAHGAGSLCGAHLSDQPTATLGEQKKSNPYLKHAGSRGAFIAAVLEGLPEAPQYFGHNAAMNHQGPPLVDWAAAPGVAAPDKALADPDKTWIVDLRDQKAYAGGHIPGSVNIGLRGRLETWVGISVPWGADLVVCGSPEEIKEAVFRLHRVGYTARGLDLAAWKTAGLPVITSRLVGPRELYDLMQAPDAPVVVDVRLPNEWMGLRIGTVLNLPLSDLTELSTKLDPAAPVITVCNSAYRSSLAVGLLERQGFDTVGSLDGGTEAWIAAGLPVYGPEAGAGATGTTGSTGSTGTPAPALRQVNLPERLEAAALGRILADLPGSVEIVDIRPPEAFADYHLPGSRNADIAEVMANPAFLAGSVPLVLVDRDGSLAMAVGGVLTQKTKRPVKVLYGGLVAWWEAMDLGGTVRARPMSATPAPASSSVAPAPSAPAPAAPGVPAAPAKPKAKSAGC